MITASHEEVDFVQLILEVFSVHGIDYFLISATARNLLFESRSLTGLRATNDWDFAIQVENWEMYQEVQETLISNGFEQTDSFHRLRKNALLVDIVPFGTSIENDGSEIEFPNGHDVMSVRGFTDFLPLTETIIIGDISIKIGSILALFGSKIVALNERKSPDDASDIFKLIEYYPRVNPVDFYDGVSEIDHVLPDDEFDQTLAAAYLNARNTGRSLSEPSRKAILSILMNWQNPGNIVNTHWQEDESQKMLGLMISGMQLA